MKTLIAPLVLFTFIVSINKNLNAQNLFKTTTYNVEEYKIEKVTGKKESHVYPDVTELKVQLGEDIFGEEFTKFSFENAAGEQSFKAWYKDETIHENNIVQRLSQRLSMLEEPNSKLVMAYFFNAGKLISNDTIYSILVAIPDVKNGIVHKFTIKTDEPNFTQEHLAIKTKEKAAWNEFRAAYKKIINAQDISEFRGAAATGAWSSSGDFKCTINPVGFKEKAKFNYYEKNDYQPKRIVLNISSMAVWMGKYESAEQIEKDIKRLETILDEESGGKYKKVYYPMYKDQTIGNLIATKVGAEKRESIKDNIFYVHSLEVTSDLSELSKTYIEVDIEMTEYRTSLIITFYQF